MLYLFNMTIMPNEGVFINRKISQKEAEAILVQYKHNFVSAIGHQGSADVFNAIFQYDLQTGEFGPKVVVNRISATMQAGDEAIALKVSGRLTEGTILTMDELEKVGYEFYHILALGT